MERKLDWKEFVNALVYCFGCGRFGKPTPKGIPDGWKVLYNPHPEGKPALHVCSTKCATKVSMALRDGPVLEPLEMGAPPLMPAKMREEALECVRIHAGVEVPFHEEAMKRLVDAKDDPDVPWDDPDVPWPKLRLVPSIGISTADQRFNDDVACRADELRGQDRFSDVIKGIRKHYGDEAVISPKLKGQTSCPSDEDDHDREE